MKNFLIEATEFTPEILFDLEKRKLSFKGVSRPEDVFKFYQPAIKWLKELEDNIKNRTDTRYVIPVLHVEFRLMYFNSASSKMLLQMLEIIKHINQMGIEVNIDWYYDVNDEAMYDDGNDLSEAVDLPFNFHPY